MLKGTDFVEYEYLHIIFEGKEIVWLISPEYDEEYLTFDDVLEIAEKNGYQGGVIILLADNALGGKGYTFGNYDQKGWYEYATTVGYA